MKDKIIEILKDHSLLRTDGVHQVYIRGVYPELFEKVADYIITLTEQQPVSEKNTELEWEQLVTCSNCSEYKLKNCNYCPMCGASYLPQAKGVSEEDIEKIMKQESIYLKQGYYNTEQRDSYIAGFKAALSPVTEEEKIRIGKAMQMALSAGFEPTKQPDRVVFEIIKLLTINQT